MQCYHERRTHLSLANCINPTQEKQHHYVAVAGQPFLANEAELVENRTQSGAYPQPQLLFRIRRKGCQPGVLYPAADREMVEVLEFTAFEAEEFVHRVIKIATDTCAT